MKSVEGETIDALRRLRHHPAIALWCGNNEIEQGLVGDGWTDRHMDWADYKVLFDEMLPNLVKEYDGERFYWPCSPHSPIGDRKKFNNPECGDAHCWDVWFGWATFEAQRSWNHRFQSEFGFQSFPEMRTVRAFAAEEDLNMSSYIMDFHQRSIGRGNKCILAYIGEYLPFPKDLDATLWLSQVSQAECIRFAVEHSRRGQPRCMGTLYWQINDMWPAPTWASIDSFGRWKALQYSARRFFAPVQISALEDAKKKTVGIHVSNQRAVAGSFTTVWTVTDCAGKVLLENRNTNTLAAQSSTLITTLDLATLNANSRDLLVWMRVEEADTVLSENLTSLTRWKHLNLKDPAITWDIERADADTFTLTLKAQAPALFVRLSHDSIDAEWSDNAFHLSAGQTKTITIRPWAKASLPQLRKGLLVSSLKNYMI
jgi:beta-mannosidase